jgi:hypothetical protein
MIPLHPLIFHQLELAAAVSLILLSLTLLSAMAARAPWPGESTDR